MKYGKFLNENNKIKYISPSLGCSSEPYKSRLTKSIEIFENLGFNIEVGSYCYSNINALSSTKENVGIEFEENYISSKSDFLLSVAGGELQMLILDYIDFEKIKNHPPKWFMGYSDNTNLCFVLTTLCDIASIYGSNAPDFGSNCLDTCLLETIDLMKGNKLKFNNYKFFQMESLISEDNLYAPYNLTYKTEIKSHLDSENLFFEGRIIGGCLDVLVNLINTKYDNVQHFNQKYGKDGIIWYFECSDLNSVGVIRSLTLLKRNNWLKHLKGFLIGRSYLLNDNSYGITMNQAFVDTLKEFHVPILYNLDIGHLKPMIPIINGSIAKVHFKNNLFEIEYKLE